MDFEEETRKGILLIRAIVLFLMLGMFAYWELSLWVFGVRQKATIVDITNVSSGRGVGNGWNETPIQKVRIRFADEDGNARHAIELVPLGWQPPENRTIFVTYFSGKPETAQILKPNFSWNVWLFFLSSLGLLGILGYIAWQAHAPIRSDRPHYELMNRRK